MVTLLHNRIWGNDNFYYCEVRNVKHLFDWLLNKDNENNEYSMHKKWYQPIYSISIFKIVDNFFREIPKYLLVS